MVALCHEQFWVWATGMKLAEMAMASKDEDIDDDKSSDGESMFSEAASGALGLWADGKKSEAVSALGGAIDARIAAYMEEDG